MKYICCSLFLLLFTCHSGQRVNPVSPVSIEPKADVFKLDTCLADTMARFECLADSLEKDSMQTVNFEKITRIINGGINGLPDRLNLWERAKKVLILGGEP